MIHKKQDLADIHHAITHLFQVPESKQDLEKYKLTADQVLFYKENGYIAGIDLLDEDQIDKLRTDLNEFIVPDYQPDSKFYEFHSNEAANPSRVLFHALGAWRISDYFHDALWNPAFTKPASQLLGDSAVRFWHDQLFYKPPQHGGVVAWHQDYSYWTRTKPMQHLTCWIGLDDANSDNGCLYYVPKSHKWGLLDKPELAGDMNRIIEFLSPEQKAQFKPIPIPLKKGQATFHHPLLLHGSYENKTDRPRRGMVINVFADGTLSDANEPMLAGTDPIPKGEPMGGKYYPILYPTQ